MPDNETLSIKNFNCEITPTEVSYDFGDSTRFQKIEFPEQAGITANSILNALPNIAAADVIGKSYILKFPEGIPGTLLKLRQGGETTTLVDVSHHFVGTASLHQVNPSAVVLFQVFSVASFATGQYFLTDISNKMSEINRKLDEVLAFLQESKRTELLSELTFVKYALKNYSTIMLSEPQRMATIGNLQRSKIKAIGDMEFYVTELEHSVVKFDSKNLTSIIASSRSLDLASQLYAISTIMEAYYAQNPEKVYRDYLSTEAENLLGLMEKRASNAIGTCANAIRESHKEGFVSKKVKPYVEAEKELLHISEVLTNRVQNPLINIVKDALEKPSKLAELYLASDGSIYQKISATA